MHLRFGIFSLDCKTRSRTTDYRVFVGWLGSIHGIELLVRVPLSWLVEAEKFMALTVVPLTLSQANELVSSWHRHHKPCVGHRFSIGVKDGDGLVGAAIVGRPVARNTDQYSIAEVTRLVTNGHPNACSKLYAAVARISKEMGFNKVQTFILASEPGTSLLASGWRMTATSPGGSWNCPSRGGRREDQPMEPKTRWERQLC